MVTQEQIAALVKRMKECLYGIKETDSLLIEAADMLEQLAADREKVAGVLKSIDPQVISVARDLGEQEKQNPEWVFIDYEANQMSFGRWAKCGPNPSPYVRLDIVLAALEPTPDAPVTVSSTEQDLGALAEHFKAKAEKAYDDGVRDAAKVVENSAYFTPDEISKMSELRLVQEKATIREDRKIHKLAAEIRALLTEKPHD